MKTYIFIIAAMLCGAAACAQTRNEAPLGASVPLQGTAYPAREAGLRGSLDWNALALSATVSISLDAHGITLPSGRTLAEETLAAEFFSRIRPKLLALPVDSSSTLQDMMNSGGLTQAGLDSLIFSVRQKPSVFSGDLATLTASYTMNLENVADLIVHHTRTVDPPRVLGSVFAGDYTGIIVIADTPLPVHGKHAAALALPCMLPKIWDANMRLVYQKENVAYSGSGVFKMARYALKAAVTMNTPFGISPELTAIAGARPLIIFAAGVYGERPTDIIIAPADADIILSRSANRALLRDGKVVIILNDAVIVSPL
jgi:hypothetical protein